MKHLFILFSIISWCFSMAKAQIPETLNDYHVVFIPQVFYEKNKTDIYGIRQTTFDVLKKSAVPVYLDENEIPVETLKNQCSVLRCMISNTASPAGKSQSRVIIFFLNCKNDTVLIFSADAMIHFSAAETRTGFVEATNHALDAFGGYSYHFTEPVSSVAPVIIPDNENDSILWNPDRKPGWDDFKGTAVDNDPADALTYTSNQTHFESVVFGNRFTVESKVACYFIKSKSWVKEGKQAPYLLNHEQRHFDIAEAGAREFRKRLGETQFTNENFRDQLKKINQEVDEKYHRLQQQYDTETDHSRIEEKQVEWNKKIDELLTGLKTYQ